jgi:DNA-binding MarR family transcriptional regulator
MNTETDPVVAAQVTDLVSALVAELLRSRGEAIVQLARQYDLSMQRAMTLMFLDRAGPSSISAVAEFLTLSLAATSQQVDQLVCAGYVTRTEDPNDRRTKVVALAERGTSFTAALRRARVIDVSERLAALPAIERESTLTAIEQILAVLRTSSVLTRGDHGNSNRSNR